MAGRRLDLDPSRTAGGFSLHSSCGRLGCRQTSVSKSSTFTTVALTPLALVWFLAGLGISTYSQRGAALLFGLTGPAAVYLSRDFVLVDGPAFFLLVIASSCAVRRHHVLFLLTLFLLALTKEIAVLAAAFAVFWACRQRDRRQFIVASAGAALVAIGSLCRPDRDRRGPDQHCPDDGAHRGGGVSVRVCRARVGNGLAGVRRLQQVVRAVGRSADRTGSVGAAFRRAGRVSLRPRHRDWIGSDNGRVVIMASEQNRF
jgi:hypothetical protein